MSYIHQLKPLFVQAHPPSASSTADVWTLFLWFVSVLMSKALLISPESLGPSLTFLIWDNSPLTLALYSTALLTGAWACVHQSSQSGSADLGQGCPMLSHRGLKGYRFSFQPSRSLIPNSTCFFTLNQFVSIFEQLNLSAPACLAFNPS